MIFFNFACDAPGCKTQRSMPLSMLCRDRHARTATFFDCALAMMRDRGWRMEGNERELPHWDVKAFCPEHKHLHRDAAT